MQLVTYADRLAQDLKGLKSLLEGELEGLFDGVHILPFFDPIDGADAGFDPTDHTRVDARVGSWDDVGCLAATHRVMADVIVNHISAESRQFQDVLRNGEQSAYWNLFLRKQDVFKDAPIEAIGSIYRPRPGSPFTNLQLDDGRRFDFWSTFSARQLDINVEDAAGRNYLREILETFSRSGIRELRLDAAGYAIKRAGTSCFMLPETLAFIGSLSRQGAKLGMESLVEVHGHYQTQIAIAEQVGRVYDFALPPLVLHALYTCDAEPLRHWFEVAPRNCVTVLDTHDGIGIVDVAGSGGEPGLLSDQQVDNLVEGIHRKTNGASRRASGHAASNLDIYQVNSTYYDALGGEDVDYLIARAIQFFAPGTPQIYYVGLLAGENDLGLVERTGVGRDINRHYYTAEEISAALRRPVVARLLSLMRLRRSSPAFTGSFAVLPAEAHQLVLRWEQGSHVAELDVDLRRRYARVTVRAEDEVRLFEINSSLQP